MEQSHHHKITVCDKLCDVEMKETVKGRHSCVISQLGGGSKMWSFLVSKCLFSTFVGGKSPQAAFFFFNSKNAFHGKFFRSLWFVLSKLLTPWDRRPHLTSLLACSCVKILQYGNLPNTVVKGMNSSCKDCDSWVRIPICL